MIIINTVIKIKVIYYFAVYGSSEKGKVCSGQELYVNYNIEDTVGIIQLVNEVLQEALRIGFDFTDFLVLNLYNTLTLLFVRKKYLKIHV